MDITNKWSPFIIICPSSRRASGCSSGYAGGYHSQPLLIELCMKIANTNLAHQHWFSFLVSFFLSYCLSHSILSYSINLPIYLCRLLFNNNFSYDWRNDTWKGSLLDTFILLLGHVTDDREDGETGKETGTGIDSTDTERLPANRYKSIDDDDDYCSLIDSFRYCTCRRCCCTGYSYPGQSENPLRDRRRKRFESQHRSIPKIPINMSSRFLRSFQ